MSILTKLNLPEVCTQSLSAVALLTPAARTLRATAAEPELNLPNVNSPPSHDDAIMSATMLQIGDQFDRFQIREHLAQGGMADIYRAYDLMNRRDVVLKIPDQMLIGDPAQYERFQRELEIINTLRHPAILRGLGSGQYNRIPYLATEFIQGQSLRDLIATAAPLSPDRAVALTRQIAEGLAYCHDHEVVHRDLKPENIMVTADDQPIIMDFGLALTHGGRRVTYANLSATAGTPDYMAPEQIEGRRGDPRTDLYALGTLLYEMLAGQVPFTADNNFAVMQLHLNGVAPRLDRIRSDVSPQLAAIVAKCLQRRPDDRYPDLHAFIDALDHPETADLSVLDQEAVTTAADIPWYRSSEVKAIGIALAILIVIILLAVVLQSARVQ
jgi:eukaryotic-like serine/threonine-protein kinase